MNDYAAYLSCVFAAVNIQRQWKRYESPLYNLFQQIELPPLARADTELLARTPVRWTLRYDERDRPVCQLSKGRPMKIQLLCLEAINYIREQGRKNVTQRYRACRRHGQRTRRMAVGTPHRNPYTVGGPVRDRISMGARR